MFFHRAQVFCFLLICITISVESLECYKCGYNEQDDYCSYLKSRWKEKPCTSTAKLSIGEIMACVKTTFDDEKEGKFSTVPELEIMTLIHPQKPASIK